MEGCLIALDEDALRQIKMKSVPCQNYTWRAFENAFGLQTTRKENFNKISISFRLSCWTVKFA